MQTLVTIIHVLVCLFLMLTVLLQSGKGGGMGAAFGGGGGGGGGTQTVFGGSGAGGFLRKVTVICAVFFMLTSMVLAYVASNTGADALKRYSAQQRKGKLVEEEARLQARESALDEDIDPTTAPDPIEDSVITPEGELPEGDMTDDTAIEGATQDDAVQGDAVQDDGATGDLPDTLIEGAAPATPPTGVGADSAGATPDQGAAPAAP